jgi:hypothetical protein
MRFLDMRQMFGNRLVTLCVLIVLATLLVACGDDSEAQDTGDGGIAIDFPSPSGDVTPRPRRSPVTTPGPTPTPLKVCAPNPDPATPALLQVFSPGIEERVKIPFHVRGWGSNIGFQGRGVAVAVVNAKQEVTQVLRLPPQPREYRIAPAGMTVTEFTQPFAADVVINGLTEPTPYCLWVYLETDAGGRPKGVLQIPVIVTP